MSSDTTSLKLHDGHFYERMFKARTTQGYSRKEIEQLTEGKCRARTLMDWETNPESQPRLGEGLRSAAEILGVTVTWLFWGDQNGKDPRE
jgi:hypothetical protein